MDLQRQARQVLANFINESHSLIGTLPHGVERADWIADRFFAWWAEQVGDELETAVGAIESVRAELQRLGGWTNPELGEALHELIHASDALASLRVLLGGNDRSSEPPSA